jgi:hypothetical protein
MTDFARVLRHASRTIFALAFFCLSVSPVAAAPITWVVTGPANPFGLQWSNAVPPGTPVTVSFTFDPDTAINSLQCPANGAAAGIYTMQMSATVTFPNFTIPYSGGGMLVAAPNGTCGSFYPFVEILLSTPGGPFGPVIPGAPSWQAYEFLWVLPSLPIDPNAVGVSAIFAGLESGNAGFPHRSLSARSCYPSTCPARPPGQRIGASPPREAGERCHSDEAHEDRVAGVGSRNR